MRKRSTEKRATILSALVEGNSINATARMTGTSKVTVLRLLADAGTYCRRYHDVFVRDLQSKRVQVDEIWSFCGCKDKALENGGVGMGSIWTWTAIDADSKLCISYLDEHLFVTDTARRLASRVQLTSDGLKAYIDAVDNAFGGQIDYAQLVKLFGKNPENDIRYSPAHCKGCRKHLQAGTPDPERISTSYVERQNLTMRMSMRRFTRLTNAFSKKIENHEHAVALHFFHYNFIRKHETLKTTPAVAAGLANKATTVLDLVRMIECEEKKLGGRLTDYVPASSKS